MELGPVLQASLDGFMCHRVFGATLGLGHTLELLGWGEGPLMGGLRFGQGVLPLGSESWWVGACLVGWFGGTLDPGHGLGQSRGACRPLNGKTEVWVGGEFCSWA